MLPSFLLLACGKKYNTTAGIPQAILKGVAFFKATVRTYFKKICDFLFIRRYPSIGCGSMENWHFLLNKKDTDSYGL